MPQPAAQTARRRRSQLLHRPGNEGDDDAEGDDAENADDVKHEDAPFESRTAMSGSGSQITTE